MYRYLSPNALLKNNIIDSRRCISYLTRVQRSNSYEPKKKLVIKFMDDDCLSICPWNKFSTEVIEKKLISNEKLNDLNFFHLIKKFDNYFHNSLKRIGWIRFLRNVIIASGNSKNKIL